MDIEKIAGEVISAGKGIFSRLKSIHGVDGAIIALPEVIAAVEKKAAEIKGMTGAQKKELAVNIINALVDIPFIPEAIEAIAISWAIDAIIAALNKFMGKNWLEKLEA